MPLPRAIIRDQAKALLIAANTDAGPLVFVGRDWPTKADMFPSLFLWTPADQKEGRSTNAKGSYLSNVTLVVKARVRGGNPAEIEIALDNICNQVEQALALPILYTAFPAIPPVPPIEFVQRITEIETESVITAQAATQIGEAAIAFHIEYVEYFEAVGSPLIDIRGSMFETDPDDAILIFDAPLAQPPEPP